MISSRFQGCSTNGLEFQSKVKKLGVYKGWRDPDLAKKPRKRSIPNPIKRFLKEFKGSLPKFEESREIICPTKIDDLTSSSANLSTSSDFIPRVVQFDTPETKQKKNKSLNNTCRPKGGVVRCAKCDYPYDSAKRRGPPHLFTPMVVNLPMNINTRIASSKAEMTGYLNFAGQAKRKVTRLKRKRSSTELYGGMVAV